MDKRRLSLSSPQVEMTMEMAITTLITGSNHIQPVKYMISPGNYHSHGNQGIQQQMKKSATGINIPVLFIIK